MFGTHFYHKKSSKCSKCLWSLFNNLYVLRQNSAGETISQVKEQSFIMRKNFLARIEQMTNGEQNEDSLQLEVETYVF